MGRSSSTPWQHDRSTSGDSDASHRTRNPRPRRRARRPVRAGRTRRPARRNGAARRARRLPRSRHRRTRPPRRCRPSPTRRTLVGRHRSDGRNVRRSRTSALQPSRHHHVAPQAPAKNACLRSTTIPERSSRSTLHTALQRRFRTSAGRIHGVDRSFTSTCRHVPRRCEECRIGSRPDRRGPSNLSHRCCDDRRSSQRPVQAPSRPRRLAADLWGRGRSGCDHLRFAVRRPR